MSSKIDPKSATEAIRRHGSVRKAARVLGTSSSATHRAAKRDESPAPQTVPNEGLRFSVDYNKDTGWAEYAGETLPPERELIEKCGLDPKFWQVTRVQRGQWEGFYKYGTGQGVSSRVVPLHSIRIDFRRLVSRGLEIASRDIEARVRPLKIRGKPRKPKGDVLAVAGLYDLHIASLCWAEETGNDYDIQIAASRAAASIDEQVARIRGRGVQRLIVPIGNDFMHFDDDRNTTSSGSNVMDADTRYAKAILAGHDVLAHMADAFLGIGCEVEFVHVPGNHDRRTSLHMAHWLKARYSDHPLVSVDVSPNRRKYREHGSVLLGFTHGDGINLRELFRVMADECAASWSRCGVREWHTGHLHQRKAIDLTAIDSTGSVVVRVNPSLAGTDEWHHGRGFVGARRCAEVWYYTSEGLDGMSCVYAEKE